MTMLPNDATTSGWLELIRAEYREMPGLILTKAQIGRLWGLDAVTCEAVIAALVGTGFLQRTSNNLYTHADRGM
jgi:hypothetical protein